MFGTPPDQMLGQTFRELGETCISLFLARPIDSEATGYTDLELVDMTYVPIGSLEGPYLT
jgi:hypothetical protein